jgi:hypothetical protein
MIDPTIEWRYGMRYNHELSPMGRCRERQDRGLSLYVLPFSSVSPSTENVLLPCPSCWLRSVSTSSRIPPTKRYFGGNCFASCTRISRIDELAIELAANDEMILSQARRLKKLTNCIFLATLRYHCFFPPLKSFSFDRRQSIPHSICEARNRYVVWADPRL